MSLWKDSTSPKPASQPMPAPKPEPQEPARFEAAKPVPTPATPMNLETDRARKESLIASDLTIEGKIEGAGSVRIAGKFKGDVNVQGDLTIEAGAKLTGSVRADKVTISGELEGNVIGASSIDLQKTGVVIGDLKARSLSVAAGATMRGKAEFGGEDGEGPKVGRHGAEIGTRQ